MSRKIKVPEEIREFLAAAGRKGGSKGGKSRSPAKIAAARLNIQAALAKQRQNALREGGRDAY